LSGVLISVLFRMNEEEHITYLTKEGHEKLQEEYSELKNVKIPAIAARIDEARQQGDLSENAEYHVAREDMTWAQTRLVELEETLRNVKIIQQKQTDSTIQMGSKVRVEVKGVVKEFSIVGIQEADPKQGFISHESPLAQALLGHSVGDVVEVKMPNGMVEYAIMNIS